MANFFLIDQSLKELGGHHHDYVRCVASAAAQSGYLTTIGTNRKFRDSDSLSHHGQIRKTFRETTYQRDSYLSGLRHLTRSRDSFLPPNSCSEDPYQLRSAISPSRWLHSLRRNRHQARRQRNIKNFAQDCDRFFKSTMLTENDHAFFATVNEMEFMGLAAFLANNPRTLQVNWHLQFHFNLFEGRTPEYQSQHRLAMLIQQCFDAALARIPYHMLHLYTTSETLADQFNRLGVGEFKVLAYPVRPELFGEEAKEPIANSTFPVSDKRLRITCPGEVRREKKMVQYLQPLVDRIWDSHIRTGNVQIVVQRPARKWASREKIKLTPPTDSDLGEAGDDWVRYYSHPLSDTDYLDLIKNTDCGLLFYDSRAYFSRRAGVLGELLSCGKPVIVPAGSWLGDQISEPNFRHVDSLCKRHNVCRSLVLDEVSWNKQNVPLPGGVLSFDESDHPFELQFELEKGESGFVLEFDWHWPQNQGVYCQFNLLSQWGDPELSQVVGHRINGMSPVTYFPSTERQVNLRMTNAFHNSTASIRLLAIHTVNLDPATTPLGAVGVIAAGEDDIPRAIDEVVSHFEHYQSSATQFAESWYRQHEPKQTFSSLVDCSDHRAA